MIQRIQQFDGMSAERHPNGFQQITQRVNAYDQAARPREQQPQQFKDGELGFFERYGIASTKWGARITAGLALDHFAPLPKINPFTQAIASNLKTVVSNLDNGNYNNSPHSYKSLLGIDNYKFDQVKTLKDYKKFFFSKEGRKVWRALTTENFRNLFEATPETPLTLKSYFKHTFFESDLRGIVRNISNGNHWQGIAGCAGIGLLGWGVISKTMDAYRYHKAKEDGSGWSKLKTLFFTGAHFIGQTIKSLACWELGTIGYMLAAALIPVGGWLPIVAGVLSGVTLSTIGYKLMSQVIPEPPKAIQKNPQ